LKGGDAWREGHRRLYKYLVETAQEGDKPTLEDLQPLYQAVAHGCQAGLQQATLKRFISFASTKGINSTARPNSERSVLISGL